jgi:hypothetical protein
VEVDVDFRRWPVLNSQAIVTLVTIGMETVRNQEHGENSGKVLSRCFESG